MADFVVANMAPLMFVALVIVLLIGYPVAFALGAIGLAFGFIDAHNPCSFITCCLIEIAIFLIVP